MTNSDRVFSKTDLQHVAELLDKDDDEECHWSPYCSREGEEYASAEIDGKPYEVWVCSRCGP